MSLRYSFRNRSNEETTGTNKTTKNKAYLLWNQWAMPLQLKMCAKTRLAISQSSRCQSHFFLPPARGSYQHILAQQNPSNEHPDPLNLQPRHMHHCIIIGLFLSLPCKDARMQTLHEKPSYRLTLADARCLSQFYCLRTSLTRVLYLTKAPRVLLWMHLTAHLN